MKYNRNKLRIKARNSRGVYQQIFVDSIKI
jgi:hypothetical protein